MTPRDKDILASVRQKLQEEHQRELVRLPKDLEADMGQSGAGGSSGWGFVPAVPPAIVAGIMRYFGSSKAG